MRHRVAIFCNVQAADFTRQFTLRLVFGLVATSLFFSAAHADIILTAPPRETTEAGEKLYKNIISSKR